MGQIVALIGGCFCGRVRYSIDAPLRGGRFGSVAKARLLLRRSQTLGDEVMRAVRFAVDEANAAGGIDGRKVEYKSYDTEAKPDLAALRRLRAGNTEAATHPARGSRGPREFFRGK